MLRLLAGREARLDGGASRYERHRLEPTIPSYHPVEQQRPAIKGIECLVVFIAIPDRWMGDRRLLASGKMV